MSITDITDKRKLPPSIKFISNFELLQKVKEQPEVQPFKITAFPTLNNNLEGIQPGELIVISGPGGTGKSLFCQTLTNDFCHSGYIPFWFSFEMPPRLFLDRFPRRGEDLSFFVPEELEAGSVDFVCNAITQSKSDLEIDMFFIDHLHYVFDMTRSKHVSLDIGTIMRRFKRLAIDLNVAIFLICHSVKAKVESVVDIGDHNIRDSSFISQESDIVLFIWNNVTDNGDSVSNKQIVKICKSRRTGVMYKAISICKAGNYLAELADEQHVKYTGGGIYSPREPF